MKKGSLLLFFVAFLLMAQGQKVAVVLSGGGSKGVSHIGVLRALEESGIPIDYIAGTSMGAIIGGLYASGYSPDQMQQIITSEEFSKWISGKLDGKYVYFFRQGQPDPSWLSFNFKYDSVLQTKLPTNIVSPVRMDFAFLELFSSASAASGYDFDHLMVPYRCVASDVRNSRPYILRRGDLGSAIRASMTFPFYFKPIRIDGHLLFDGGMYNNFPSDVVLKDFNPDIIIGSKAANQYPDPREDDFVSQLTSMLMGITNFDLYCEASVMIEPKLKTVNVIDFTNTTAFIDSGYVAAIKQIPHIREFVLDTVSQAMHDSIRKNFNLRKPEIKVNNVEVRGLQQGQAQYVANAVMGQISDRKVSLRKGNDLDIDEIKSGYFKILGENRLKSAFPTLRYDTITQRYKFVIDAQYEKDIIADFGGSLSSGGSNEIFLQLKYGLWRKMASTVVVNGSFGRFYNSALVGGHLERPGRKPLYLDLQYSFNQFNYYLTKSFFFVDDSPAYLYENNTHLRFDIGFPITYKGKIEAGFTVGTNRINYFQNNTPKQEDNEDRTKFNFYSPYLELEFSTLNRKQYANQGSHFLTSIQFVSGAEHHSPGTTSILQGDYMEYHNYFVAKLLFDKYFHAGRVYRPGISFEAQANNLGGFRNYTSTTLFTPAYAPVYEMTTIYQSRYRSTGFSALGLHNVIILHKKFDFRLDGYLMLPIRQLSSDAMQQPVRSKLFPTVCHVASASLVVYTPIGPLSASLTHYDDGTPLSFFINIGYIIFNRSAF